MRHVHRAFGIRDAPLVGPDARTREGMAAANAKGPLKGKQPKLSETQRKHLLTLHDAGEHTQVELAELFRVPGLLCTASSSGAPAEAMGNLARIQKLVGASSPTAGTPTEIGDNQ